MRTPTAKLNVNYIGGAKEAHRYCVYYVLDYLGGEGSRILRVVFVGLLSEGEARRYEHIVKKAKVKAARNICTRRQRLTHIVSSHPYLISEAKAQRYCA